MLFRSVEEGRIVSTLTTHVFGEAPSRAQRRVAAGDILMSTVRPNLLGFARITNLHSDCVASTGFAVLSAKSGFNSDYLYHYLFSAHIVGQLNALVVGSNYPAISSSDVEGLVIYCPSFEKQQEISKIFNAEDVALLNLRGQLNRLREQKKSLMQQLLTGKRRVKVKESTEPLFVIG